MFRRRKPEDEPEPPMQSHGQQTPAPVADAAPDAGLPLDTGLGVPPRPPTPTQAPAPFKDPIMGRPPFATPLAAAITGSTGNPPMPPSAPPRPPGPPAVRSPMGREPSFATPERRTLVVGRGISVQGVVQDAERLVVEGTVEASLINAAELSVSPGGLFRGEIEVEDAEVSGTVDGTLTARGNLVVRATGVVTGTARCRRLQVEDGGQLTGRIEMLSDGARAPEPARAAPSPVPSAVPSYES